MHVSVKMYKLWYCPVFGFWHVVCGQKDFPWLVLYSLCFCWQRWLSALSSSLNLLCKLSKLWTCLGKLCLHWFSVTCTETLSECNEVMTWLSCWLCVCMCLLCRPDRLLVSVSRASLIIWLLSPLSFPLLAMCHNTGWKVCEYVPQLPEILSEVELMPFAQTEAPTLFVMVV